MYDTRGIGRYSPRLGKVSRGETSLPISLIIRVCEQLLEINSHYSTTHALLLHGGLFMHPRNFYANVWLMRVKKIVLCLKINTDVR
jgi:hypothetical protein